MADNATIEIQGLEERLKQLGDLSTKNPVMEKRITEVIRKVMAEVQKALQGSAKSGLYMEADPRKAYKAIRKTVYRKLFGGNVNIITPRKSAGVLRYYEPTRHPSPRGGNRISQSETTHRMMSYTGADRSFILRWLNEGTDVRYSGHGRNGRTQADKDRFITKHNGAGYRGGIMARNWFGGASERELQNAAARLDQMINDIILGIMY